MDGVVSALAGVMKKRITLRNFLKNSKVQSRVETRYI